MDTDTIKPPTNTLAANAVYFGDNGRAMCRDCAGHTAKTTGRDLSGQKITRATEHDVDDFHAAGIPLGCEGGHVTLSVLVGSDGWPLVQGVSL